MTQIDLIAGNEGTVTNPRNAGAVGQLFGCENWAYWGVTEHFGGDDYLTYVQNDGQTIVRTRVSDGVTTPVASFPGGLSDMCSFTASLDTDRWYFHYEGFSGAFNFGSDENIGFADAEFNTEVRIDRVQPDPRTTRRRLDRSHV